MESIVSRLDVTQIFCDVDDFCKQWKSIWQQVPQLQSMIGERRSKSRMHISEMMRIVIAFHATQTLLRINFTYVYLASIPVYPYISITTTSILNTPDAINFDDLLNWNRF